MPNCAVKVVPTFHEYTKYYTITKEIVDGSGSFDVLVNSAIADKAAEGNAIKVDAHPGSGFGVASITVNGSDLSVTDPNFTMPAEDIVVKVTFVKLS